MMTRHFFRKKTAATRPVYDEYFADDDTQLVAIKFFAFDTEAQLYAARLREAGIPFFLSNSHTLTALPLVGSGIGLHVREEDAHEAIAVITRVEYEVRGEEQNFCFHDADQGEIAYEKSLWQPSSVKTWWLALVVILMALMILLAQSLNGFTTLLLPKAEAEGKQVRLQVIK